MKSLLLVLLSLTGMAFAQQLFVAATDTQSELNADLFASIISPEMNNLEMAEIDGGQGHYHNGTWVSAGSNTVDYNRMKKNQDALAKKVAPVVNGVKFVGRAVVRAVNIVGNISLFL